MTDNEKSFMHLIYLLYAHLLVHLQTEHPTGDGEGNGLYEAMRKEVWHAVEEIKTQLEQVSTVKCDLFIQSYPRLDSIT